MTGESRSKQEKIDLITDLESSIADRHNTIKQLKAIITMGMCEDYCLDHIPKSTPKTDCPRIEYLEIDGIFEKILEEMQMIKELKATLE